MAKVRVGIVGAGGIARQHFLAWLELGADVVIFSVDENAPVLVEECGGGRVASSLEELLSAVDIVDVCAPTYVHREIVEAAADAGRDIVCEKPLALTAADAKAMVQRCESAGVRLFPAHIVRYFPEYVPMHDAVVGGNLGKIAMQRFSRVGESPAKGWFHDPDLSGGIIMDQMIHDIDFARWNAGEVVEVFARCIADDDSSVAQVFLTHDGGAISALHGAWAAEGSAFTTRYFVAGDEGYLENDSSLRSPLVLDIPAVQKKQGSLLPKTSYNESPFVTELRDFLEATGSGESARVSPEDGVIAVAIAEAANQSAATGKSVQLPNANDSSIKGENS